MNTTLPENRGLLMFYLLSIITLGIYPLYMIHAIARDVNIACAEDGKHTPGLIVTLLLTIVTIGIYGILWPIFVLERQNRYMIKRNLTVRVTGIGYFLWSYIGSIIIIGPFVALYKFLHAINDLAAVHNQEVIVGQNPHPKLSFES